jgi:hypothetical protein
MPVSSLLVYPEGMYKLVWTHGLQYGFFAGDSYNEMDGMGTIAAHKIAEDYRLFSHENF